VGTALLAPHTCYWPAIREALTENIPLHGIAHITGGGLYDNVPRILPENVSLNVDAAALNGPPIFNVIRERGAIDPYEMYRVFNMGAGMVWLLPPDCTDAALTACRKTQLNARVIGEVVPGNRTVTIANVPGA
jgi:phosphoribosylformylglycinamidine cyclo-ligase